MRFYIADCHFGHDKVRLLDGRPFASVEEMDEAMIVRWNERVRKKKDEVVILGDLCLGKGEQVNELLHKLNGKKYLVTGNHDRLFLRDKKFDPSLLEWVKPYAELKDNGRSWYSAIIRSSVITGSIMVIRHICCTGMFMIRRIIKMCCVFRESPQKSPTMRKGAGLLWEKSGICLAI